MFVSANFISKLSRRVVRPAEDFHLQRSRKPDRAGKLFHSLKKPSMRFGNTVAKTQRNRCFFAPPTAQSSKLAQSAFRA
jgi:hypothetical protein